LRTFQVGTPGYIAPEAQGLFSPDEPDEDVAKSNFSYTAAVDIWAVGEVTVKMITGSPSFPEPRALFRYVVQGEAFPEQNLRKFGASPDCRDFVRIAMSASPAKRLSAAGALGHAWLKAHQFIDQAPDSTHTRR
jgi:serine/threonine protein kinase